MNRKININEILKMRTEEKRKIINYGKFYATIDNIEVKKINNELFHVKMFLVGVPIDNFDGYEDKYKKIKYNAPISTVSLSRYLIDTTKNFNIYRNIKKIILIAEQFGYRDKIKDEYNNFQELLKDFSKINFKGKYAYFVIGARELGYNDKGYKKYASYILDNELIDGQEYYSVHKDENKLINFDEDKHIIRMNDNDTELNTVLSMPPKNDDNLPDFLKDKPQKDNDISDFMDMSKDEKKDVDINDFLNTKEEEKDNDTDFDKIPF